MACPARGKQPTGMQEKPDDKWTTPLCNYHHQSGVLAQHKIGEQSFWFEVHGRDPFDIAERLFVESGGAAREIEPSVKRARKTKPRDRTAPKRKILQRSSFPVGRKLPTRPFSNMRQA